MRRFWVSIVLVGSTFGVSFADCGTPLDGLKFRAAMRSRIACERKQALGEPVQCEDPQAVCADQVDRVAELVFGAVGVVDRSEPGWKCQRAIATTARRYLQKRVRELISTGRRQVAWAPKVVRRLARRCGAPGPSLPVLGGACANQPGPFDPVEAALCMRGTLEAIAQEVTGVDIAPNILLVLTDDQRADTMWAMPLTRALIGSRGIEFAESFVSTSLCCPDRASILTGLYAHNHGVQSNAGALVFDHNGDTIARQLQENGGYRTALLGKYMVQTGTALGTWVPPGWDQWQVFMEGGNDGSGRLYYNYHLNENGALRKYGSDPADYSTDLLGGRARSLIAAWRSRPWFIELSVFAPHPKPIPADRHIGAYGGVPPHRPPSYVELDLSDKPSWLGIERFYVQLTPSEPAATDARRIDQLETLLAVDEVVASLSDQLEALGLTDNTLVVFTSDNGVLWLEHWLRLKNYPYEEAVRVPLLMRYPKFIHTPRQESRLVQSIDFYPTFAQLAGVAGPPVNGRSLVALLRDEAFGWREDILLEHFGAGTTDPSQALRTKDWKLIDTDASAGVTAELYDMNADPYELDNLADEPAHAALIGQMRARLSALLAE